MPDRLSIGAAMPVFNGERFVADALRSVLAQRYPVDAVVVVDDGSRDGSVSVASQLGPPVRVVPRAHAGVGAARSHAARLLRTDVLVVMDADDLLTPWSVDSRMRVLSARPEVDIVFGQVRSFSECRDGRPLAVDEPRPGHTVGAMLIRRVAFERVGPFTAGLHVAEGLDWLLRAHELGLVEATVNDQVLWRRVHDTNNSLAERRSLNEFPRVLKASLDRRRAGYDPRR
jgi:glycosyltransferase involved in cell wall biosynthesis